VHFVSVSMPPVENLKESSPVSFCHHLQFSRCVLCFVPDFFKFFLFGTPHRRGSLPSHYDVFSPTPLPSLVFAIPVPAGQIPPVPIPLWQQQGSNTFGGFWSRRSPRPSPKYGLKYPSDAHVPTPRPQLPPSIAPSRLRGLRLRLLVLNPLSPAAALLFRASDSVGQPSVPAREDSVPPLLRFIGSFLS